MSCWEAFTTFFTVIFLLGRDERCCRKRKLCRHPSPGWEHKKLRLFPLVQTSEFGQLDSTLKSEFAAPFDHFMQFFFLQTLERLRDILTTWVRPWFERKERTYLWSRQQSPENRFSSLFLINLWAKTRDSDILQRRLREIYNPSGRSLSSISHEDLTVLSCEAGDGVLFFYCSSDRSRLAFLCGAVGMWQQKTWCGHWKQSRSWQVEGPEQWGDCRVGPQLQFL